MTGEHSSNVWIGVQEAVEGSPPVLDFVLPGLKAGTVGALVSPGGSGKSMLALQLSSQIAGGPDLLEIGDLPTGPVAYLSAEDDAEILRSRLHALGQHWSPGERERIYERLAVGVLYGRKPDLFHPEWQRFLRSVAADNRLVILDTLRRFHQQDENDGGAMADLLALLESVCRETGTTILFLHHTSKLGALNAGGAQQASRGSSVLTDNARWQVNLVTMSEVEAKRFGVDADCRYAFVRLVFAKLNYTGNPGDRWFRRSGGGVLVPAVLEEKKNGSREKTGGGRDVI